MKQLPIILFFLAIAGLTFVLLNKGENYSDSYGRSYISDEDSEGRVIITLPDGMKVRGRYVNQYDADEVRVLDNFIQGR